VTPRYLLDTNILVHFVRDDVTWQKLRSYSLLVLDPRPAISVVTVGELHALAERRKWQGKKLTQINFILAAVDHLDISVASVYATYARIDTISRSAGRPMGKNDLWIAATANEAGCRLLTTDRDFYHLAPKYLDLEYVPQGP
jgi:tRNA(fMet)-specific endonuclease VapC